MHPIHPMVVHFSYCIVVGEHSVRCVGRFDGGSQQFRETSFIPPEFSVFWQPEWRCSPDTSPRRRWSAAASRKQAIEIHEELGGSVFWIFLGLLGLRLASFWGWMREQPTLVLIIGLSGGLLLLIASYFGGDLVYRFGAGVLPR
jgi:uncharacterized membrane protein